MQDAVYRRETLYFQIVGIGQGVAIVKQTKARLKGDEKHQQEQAINQMGTPISSIRESEEDKNRDVEHDHIEAYLGGRDREQVPACHEDNPERVGVAFDRCAAGVPYEAIACHKVFGVTHGNHCVVEEGEIALAAYDEAGTVDKY